MSSLSSKRVTVFLTKKIKNSVNYSGMFSNVSIEDYFGVYQYILLY